MAKVAYLFITLLLVVGTQIASSKSVGEVVKRQAEEETTDISTTPIDEETTTTVSPEETDAATVKPLDEDTDNKLDAKKDDEKKDKQSKNKKPILPDIANRGGVEPSTSLLPPMPFSCIPPSFFGQSPPLARLPAAFASQPWNTYSFLQPPPIPEYLPPHAGGYDYPQPSGPAFSASSGFASASASASANGQGGSVSTSTSPGGSHQASFGIGNRGSFGGGPSGPFPAGGVSQSSSSHSSSGPGGQQSSSSISNSGPDGVHTSYSHSGPNGLQQGSYGAPFPGGSGPFPNNVGGSSGSFVSVAGTTSSGGQPSFIGIRGSFPADDDGSVAIEVSGPENTRIEAPAGAHISGPVSGPAGVPQYSGPNYSYSGPGYASSGSYSPGYYGGPGPAYSPYNNIDAVFQQYFAQLQAQQEAFQRQIQAQIAAQQQAGGTFASGGAFMTKGHGQVDPNAQVYVNTRSSPNSASAATSLDSRFGFGGTKSSVSAFPYPNKNKKNSIWDQSNQVDSRFGGANEPASAFSSINVGPQGGYQQGAISPARPGIFSRFGEDVPPPSGNSYGVFSSSSSSSSTGPDGKTITQKSATVGVNDNGKVSVKTVHDP